ncbi:MAG: TVP38/TMEM64 family protein [Nitrospirae bacterium]|nr:TVP38/TMEM64 family protein [Nitrospirota bacterium]
MKRYPRTKIVIFIALIVVLYLIHSTWDITSFFNPERLQVMLNNAGMLGPLFYMFLMAVAVVISPIPSLPLDITAGAVFGPILGTLYSVVGGLAGAIVSFLIARFLGREVLERFVGGHINFCTQCSNKLLSKVVFISRLVPFISFDIVSYGAGLTKMSLRAFTIMTFLGMIPLTFVYTSFGAVFIVHKGISTVLGVCMVAIFFILPRWIEKHKPLFFDKYFGKHTKQ